MGKGGKVIVFIIVVFVLVLISTAIKQSGGGAVMSIAGIAILFLYRALFKKNNSEGKQREENNITLKK